MKRMELIGCRSVEKEIVCALRESIQGLYYTLLPQIPGGDEPDYQSEAGIWTNLNFLLISYLDDENAIKAAAIIQDVKEQFPRKGIKLFFIESSEQGISK